MDLDFFNSPRHPTTLISSERAEYGVYVIQQLIIARNGNKDLVNNKTRQNQGTKPVLNKQIF